MAVGTHTLSFPGAILRRGFWLYVWRVETPAGELLYVGRTGDNSSPHATPPYQRMGQHLGLADNQNALRRHLSRRGIVPEDCPRFEFIAHGPLYPEVVATRGDDREALMLAHYPLRDVVGAMEKALAEELVTAGYEVLNTVKWKHPRDPQIWDTVRSAFAEHFPKLISPISSAASVGRA